MSRLHIVFWIAFGLALGVYITMVVWSLPTVSAAAGGLVPFDLRPSGYTYDEARQFLVALSPDGKTFYLGVQHLLDLFYPPLVTATLFLGIAILTPADHTRARWLLACVTLPIVVFDYLENTAVAVLLHLSVGEVTPELVAVANRWTLLKSVFSALTMTTLLILLIAWGWRRWRRGASPIGAK